MKSLTAQYEHMKVKQLEVKVLSSLHQGNELMLRAAR